MVAFEHRLGGVPRGVIPAQAVVQNRARARRQAGQHAETGFGGQLNGGLDQLGRLLLAALPGREHHRGICNRRVAGRLRDQAIFFDQPPRRGQLAGDQLVHAEVADGELQLDQGADVAGDLDLVSGQGVPGVEVPQLQSEGDAGSPAGQPQPTTDFRRRRRPG